MADQIVLWSDKKHEMIRKCLISDCYFLLCACMYIYNIMYIYIMYMYICVKRECVSVWVWVWVCVCGCVHMSERELCVYTVCVYKSLCECVWEREIVIFLKSKFKVHTYIHVHVQIFQIHVRTYMYIFVMDLKAYKILHFCSLTWALTH